jgi:hypothetical protein
MAKNIERLAGYAENAIEWNIRNSLNEIKEALVRKRLGEKTKLAIYVDNYNTKVKNFKDNYGVEFPGIQEEYNKILPEIKKYVKVKEK